MALNVLIVDDDPTTRTLLARLLTKRLGCEVRESGDGLAAYLALESAPADLVLLDVSMPTVTGQELLHKLRNDQRFATLPIVMITATNDRETVTDSIGQGVLDYIRKPFNLAVVERRLIAVLRGLGHTITVAS